MKLTSRLAAGLLAGALALPAGAAAAFEARPLQPVPAGDRNIVLAQGADAAFRVNQLEEQVRALNGQIEELTFQLLQMQEQLRKMQEDNEFRFQELEEKRGSVEGPAQSRVAEAPPAPAVEEPLPGKSGPSEQDTGAQRSDGDQIARVLENERAAPKTIDGVEVYEGPSGPVEQGLEPKALGTLVFDANGNVIGAEPGAPLPLGLPPQDGQPVAPGGVVAQELPPPGGAIGAPPAAAQEQVAALPAEPASAEQLYSIGYNYVQAGDYTKAETSFREFASAYPQDARAGEAGFWLGDSILSQGRYEEAAKVFLDTHKRFPQSRMAPQNLLKLGVSLAGMNQRELACATFAEVPKKYPGITKAVRDKVAAEQKAASCKNK